MFRKSAFYYDAIYRAYGKDYKSESKIVLEHIGAHKTSTGKRLLDAGCGTGGHLPFLSAVFDCEGLDLDGELLRIASRRCPKIPLHEGDMATFRLPRRFDVIVCLFGAITYVRRFSRLVMTLQNFRDHLRPGGVVLVEPFVSPEQWQEGQVHAIFADDPGFKAVRMSTGRRHGTRAVLDFHYMIGKPDGVRTFSERHQIGLFTAAEYREAFTRAGLSVDFDERGPMGRGLYIGTVAA